MIVRKDVFVYIAGPIAPLGGYTIEENVAEASKMFLKLSQLGIPAYCPHLTALLPTAHTFDYKLWTDIDFAIIDRCTHMIMLPRWAESKGATEELLYADSHGIPAFRSLPELLGMLGEE